MHQQDSFQPPPLQFPLPGQQAGQRRRHGRQQRSAEVAVRNQRDERPLEQIVEDRAARPRSSSQPGDGRPALHLVAPLVDPALVSAPVIDALLITPVGILRFDPNVAHTAYDIVAGFLAVSHA
jgi:hypothetical protein